MRKHLLGAVALTAVIVSGSTAQADMAAAEKWIDEEFQPSALSVDEQKAEMQWFIDAAAPYAGMEINVLSETIPTHSYESEVLTKAFEDITGIKVNHQLLGEGEVVQAVQTQMQTQRNLYDGYVNASALIGTPARLAQRPRVSIWMTLSARPSQRARLASFTSCPISNSPPSTGSAKTGLIAKICRRSSKRSTAMIWACRSIGRPTKISPSSSACMSKRSTAPPCTATWTMASARRTLAGG